MPHVESSSKSACCDLHRHFFIPLDYRYGGVMNRRGALSRETFPKASLRRANKFTYAFSLHLATRKDDNLNLSKDIADEAPGEKKARQTFVVIFFRDFTEWKSSAMCENGRTFRSRGFGEYSWMRKFL